MWRFHINIYYYYSVVVVVGGVDMLKNTLNPYIIYKIDVINYVNK